jgi:uncharacterized OsmC-like protein
MSSGSDLRTRRPRKNERQRVAMITVRPLDQKRLLAVAGRHALVTDRKPEDGGTDIGCTSGELLLMAIGSCASGSIRNFLKAAGLDAYAFEVAVALQPNPQTDGRDAIAITISVPAGMIDGKSESVMNAALSGAVVSRIRLGSQVEVRCQTTPASTSETKTS